MTTDAPISTSKSTHSTRATAAGAIGNVLEQYDSVIYAFSAITMAKLFFPDSGSTSGLMLTFGVFAVGFLARPFGAVVFGYFGDKYGRRTVLVWSIVLMAVCTVLIGLLPTYHDIGVAAPLILTLIRIGQGMSTAGETAGSATFIVEHAPNDKRGLLGSFQQVSSGLGFLLASLVSIGLSLSFTDSQIESWAWRLPFLFGAVTGIVALYIRIGVPETPEFARDKTAVADRPNPLKVLASTSLLATVKSMFIISLLVMGYYMFLTYVPTFLRKVVGVATIHAQLSNLICLGVFVVCIPFFGRLSDRIGRKPVLMIGAIGFLVGSVPLIAILATGALPAVYGGQIVIAVLLAAVAGVMPATLAEMFPTNVRFSAMSIGWNFSNTLFGGTAPLLATFLITATGIHFAPAFLGVFAAVLCLAIVIPMKETHKAAL
ncbi:MFS transporter [Rhodococcoides kyotonense]|uniref:Putative proline/betaine transporter n=1 Tax=Rhodococcoides kyotonense TaxID=398843 RepID=A0A239MZH6_9NOCA|nr:MFS transporter [Rhodococcus kyotonensis]SNT48106.1 MFS transporter, MHS family, proline/betaine transporter [Rhodococcus kyotonensis]